MHDYRYTVLIHPYIRLIKTATIAFDKDTAYERWAVGQEEFGPLISTIVNKLPGILEQDEKDKLAGIVAQPVQVMWGAIDGGPGVRSGENWAQV